MPLTAWPVRTQPPCHMHSVVPAGRGGLCWGRGPRVSRKRVGCACGCPGPDEVRVQEHPPETERILGGESDLAAAAAGASGGGITGSSSVLRGLRWRQALGRGKTLRQRDGTYC